MATTMKLSEAIRTGGGDLPQCKGRFFVQDETGEVKACCAWGGASIALKEGPLHLLVRYVDTKIKNPFSNRKRRITDIIGELNDRHGWTRAQIADWVEQQGY